MQDVNNKVMRKKQRGVEAERLRQSLMELEEKKKGLETQRQIYVDYVQSCLTNQQSGKRRRLTFSSKGKPLPSSFAEPAAFTADKLFAKGVLVELRDVPESQFETFPFPTYPFPRLFVFSKSSLLCLHCLCSRNKVTLTITQIGTATFSLSAVMYGVHSGSMELRLEDLLETKFNKVPHISLFDGTARVNVNLFLHLINKKFFF